MDQDQCPASIMIVDDMPDNLRLLESLLRDHGLRVRAFPRGDLALKAAQKKPPDLFLLDILMPDMDGIELCQRLKQVEGLQNVPVLFISALSEPWDKTRAFAAGGVDYVTKPFDPEEVLTRVRSQLRQHQLWMELEEQKMRMEELVQAKVAEMSRSQLHTMHALSAMLESKEDETVEHVEHVRACCVLLAQALHSRNEMIVDDRFIEHIRDASALHDVGKFGVMGSKEAATCRLAGARKIEAMKSHTVIGERTLQSTAIRRPQEHFLKMAMAIARSHHEKWDGSGYPDGLSGTAIPLPARILAVADAYDGLRTSQPYKPAFSHEESIRIIELGAGEYFDPLVVKGLLSVQEDCSRIHTVETPSSALDLNRLQESL